MDGDRSPGWESGTLPAVAWSIPGFVSAAAPTGDVYLWHIYLSILRRSLEILDMMNDLI